CAAGIAVHDPEYLRLARALCDRYEVHLVADEIAVGFGRTGSLFAHQQAGIRPDFLCLSKGLTGGTLALSAVLTTDTVYDAFYDDRTARGFLHSHSYTGNPLACRAALATLEIFEQEDWMARNRATAARLTALCQPLSEHPKVLRSRQLGMLWAFDVDTDDPTFSRRYHAAALKHGLLLRPIGSTLYFMPPYVIDEGESHHLAEGALAALNEALP
ncbi:MAG TPA: aminotransferase class III-fold pyridoxal phosphate-dependent enzyme, partial [Rhizobacter sp.]|nr:aminotransferase class III-fold pyridoxal phosphate-dependent enzyme [Rhizobacter sp.]